jgi:hypothetical protein
MSVLPWLLVVGQAGPGGGVRQSLRAVEANAFTRYYALKPITTKEKLNG